MFETRITKLLGIKYPIVQGGMVYLSRPELVAAVSNAGGLGILTSADCDTKEELRDELRQTKSLTDKPFGVNINLSPAARPVNTEEYIDTVNLDPDTTYTYRIRSFRDSYTSYSEYSNQASAKTDVSGGGAQDDTTCE